MDKGLTTRMVGGTLSLGSLSVVSMVLGLLSTVVIARQFPAEVFGAFILLQVIVGFLAQMSSLGLDMTIAKFVAGSEDAARRQELVSTALWLRLGAVVLACLLAWLARSLLLHLFSASVLTALIVFVPLLFLLESGQNLLKAILQGFFRFTQIGVTDLITSALNLLLIAALVSSSRQGAEGLALARAAALAVACVFAWIVMPVKVRPVAQPAVVKEMARFGLPLQINDILHFTFTRIDTLVIGALLGPTDIAIYEVARKIPDSLARLYEPFRAVYFAFSSRLFALGDRDRAARLLNDSSRLVAFAATLGAALALLYGRDLIGLLFSDKYLASAPLFVLLMVNLCLRLVGNVLGTSLVAGGEPDKPAVINVFNTAVSLAGTVLLVPQWGVAGATVGTILGTVAVYPAMMLFLRRRVDARVLPYLKPMAVFCVWAALVLWLHPAGLALHLASLALFLTACALLSVVTRHDLMTLVEGSGLTAWRPAHRLFPGGGAA